MCFANKNKVALLGLIFLAVLSEYFVLNQNFSLKSKIAQYNHLDDLLTNLQAERETIRHIRNNIEGHPFPLNEIEFAPESTQGFPGIYSSEYAIIFCFTDYDCESCLIGEIDTWNESHRTIDKKLCQIIGITDKSSSRGNVARLRAYPKTPVALSVM